MQSERYKITLMTVILIFRVVFNKNHFLVLLQGSGAGEKLLLVYFLVISDSGISSRFVGKERGVHTQVKQSIFPGLPYLAFHHLQC